MIFFDEPGRYDDGRYTKKVTPPQYAPSSTPPALHELVDKRKYNELVDKINRSNVSEEEKTFLKLAATRHIVFTYSKIADYYAHASKETQELMEQSALVIIDFDDAIANGYVALNQRVNDIMIDSGELAKEGTTRHTGKAWENRNAK